MTSVQQQPDSNGLSSVEQQQAGQPAEPPGATTAAAAAPAAATSKPPARMPALPPRKAAGSSSNSPGGRRVVAASSRASPPPGGVRGVPSLPARGSAGGGAQPPAEGGVIDPEEPEATQRLRASVHDIRVRLVRAAQRLGYQHDSGLVKQVLYRLYLAEKLKEPFRKGSRRPDAALLAARDAARLESEQGPASPLGLNITILVIGLTGTGKTQLIHSLLGMQAAGSGGSSSGGSSSGGAASSSGGAPLEPFRGGTSRVSVSRACVLGVSLTLVDTPGLTASAAGTAANAAVLRGIKRAFKQHQPDLVLYVDRFDRPCCGGGELPVLQALTNACGAHMWLNTIVALTHAGSLPPSSGSGQMSWDSYSQQRSQLLQLIIRSASGDARLMNPIAFAESHPCCRRNAQGQAVIPSGVAWQQHMLVLIVSAKLLADAEAALQMAPDAASVKPAKALGPGGGLDAASMRELMGRPEGPPVRYLMTQLTGFSQPLLYPDHGNIMELRAAQQRLRSLKGWRARKELSRQIRFRLLQMRQLARRQQRTTDLLCKATRAGGKLQLSQPRTATRVRPSVQPPVGHRYRVLEPGAGWIVRPHIEPHGLDNSDNVEGFMAEKAGVLRPAERLSGSSSGSSSSSSGAADAAGSAGDGSSSGAGAGSSGAGGAGGSSSSSSSSQPDLLRGAPYRLSASASAGKEQVLVQARGEMSMYHDPAGLASTTLSADVQTSGAPVTPDMLLVLRLDSQRRGFPVAANNPSAGLMLARLAQDCKPHRGPLAAGLRLQDCVRLSGPGGTPVELDVALGQMFCRPGLESDDAWGANAELRSDARGLLGSRYAAPLSLSGSLMGHRGERMAAVSAAMQVQRGRRSRLGGKLQLNSRGVASLGLQVRSDGPQWWGLVGVVPLLSLGWDALTSALSGRAGGGGEPQDADAGGGLEDQQQQQQEQQQQQTLGSHLQGLAPAP